MAEGLLAHLGALAGQRAQEQRVFESLLARGGDEREHAALDRLLVRHGAERRAELALLQQLAAGAVQEVPAATVGTDCVQKNIQKKAPT